MTVTDSSEDQVKDITGTLIWYYYICCREVWLMSRQIVADQQDENMEWGRYLHENTYAREKKEISWDSIKMDSLSKKRGELVVAEVKKTSSYLKSAKMQVFFYLYNLKLAGVDAVGELRFPEEKRKEVLELDETAEAEIKEAIQNIKSIIAQEMPPEATKINFCRKCAYREFCWA